MLIPVLNTLAADLQKQIIDSIRQWPSSSHLARREAYLTLRSTFVSVTANENPDDYQSVVDIIGVNTEDANGRSFFEEVIVQKASVRVVRFLANQRDLSSETFVRAYKASLAYHHLDAALELLENRKFKDRIGSGFLHVAARVPNSGVAIKKYLKRENIDVNAIEDNFTAIHRAASSFEVDNLKVLLEDPRIEIGKLSTTSYPRDAFHVALDNHYFGAAVEIAKSPRFVLGKEHGLELLDDCIEWSLPLTLLVLKHFPSAKLEAYFDSRLGHAFSLRLIQAIVSFFPEAEIKKFALILKSSPYFEIFEQTFWSDLYNIPADAAMKAKLIDFYDDAVGLREAFARRPILNLISIHTSEAEIRILLQKQPSFIQIAEANGYSPLFDLEFRAAGYDNLVRAGLDVNAKNADGHSVLEMGLQSLISHLAMYKILQSPNLDLRLIDESKGPLIHRILALKSLPILETFLQRKDINLNETDEEGRTPVMLAIMSGNANGTKLLIEDQRTNLSLKDKYGKAILDFARERGAEPIVRKLIKARPKSWRLW